MLNSETRPIIGNGKITIEVKRGRRWVEEREIINLGDLCHEHNILFKDNKRKMVQYQKGRRIEWGNEELRREATELSTKETENESNGNAE